MSQDVVSDILNEIMNAIRSGKTDIVVRRYSKLLIKVLEIMKRYDYVDFKLEDEKLTINIKNLSECKSIKPRYSVDKKSIGKYTQRFLPARNFGYVILSTNKGLMTQEEAQESKIGGSLIAYFF